MAVFRGPGASSRGEELTTTSYAILGLLALRPWTAYELAQQMQRSLHQFWPRAERKIYDEPKRLVRLGLATAIKASTGRRPRTLYQVTPAGRRALRRWMATESAPPQFESEAILRVFLADQGSKADLLAAIASMHAEAEVSMSHGAQRCQAYLNTGGPFPERLHIIALMARFLTELADAYERWATWAMGEVESWPDTKSAAGWDPSPTFRLVVDRAKGSPQ
jgi:DNA-binding PadR family transcriptional regulator